MFILILGVGKTTLTKKISAALAEKGVSLSGFYTEEVRKDGVREGFDIVTVDGVRGRLARDAALLSPPITHRIGKYGVFVKEFETIAIPCLTKVFFNCFFYDCYLITFNWVNRF